MLIYHKTNGKNITTQVIMGCGASKVSHGSYIWEKHQSNVDKLVDNGDVFVTGGAYASAIYEGKMEPRKMFQQFIEEIQKDRR